MPYTELDHRILCVFLVLCTFCYTQRTDWRAI